VGIDRRRNSGVGREGSCSSAGKIVREVRIERRRITDGPKRDIGGELGGTLGVKDDELTWGSWRFGGMQPLPKVNILWQFCRDKSGRCTSRGGGQGQDLGSGLGCFIQGQAVVT
jgi:hypothetical protein